MLDQLVSDFQATHPSIQVEIDYKPNAAYGGLLTTALAGGAAPDVIGWIEGTSIRTAAKDKQIVPIDSKVNKSALVPAAAPEVVFDGHVWGVPLAAYTVGIFYQRPIFKKYGLKVPTTWAELTAVSDKLHQNGVTRVVDAREGRDHPVLLLHDGRVVDPRHARASSSFARGSAS